MAIVAVFNRKDGVGKTTTALNLLAGIARRGQRPWGIDLDPGAELSRIFGTSARSPEESMFAFFTHRQPLEDVGEITRSGVILCPAHSALDGVDALLGKGLDALTRLRHALRRPEMTTAAVVVDCPAAFGALSINAMFASHVVLIPMTADVDGIGAALAVDRALNALEPLYQGRAMRRYLLTRCGPDDDAAAAVRDAVSAGLSENEICRTVIAENPDVASSPTRVAEIFRRSSQGGGLRDYDALLDELWRDGLLG